MLAALFMMGGLGLLVGAGLAYASKIFYVYVNPKILEIEEALPGANCGGCGLPGCSANAEAIVAGTAAPNSCVAAGAEVADAIAEILGVTIEASEPDIALPGCYFGLDNADLKYVYDGMNDCRAVALLGGGNKVCTIGCLGLGTCAKACPFDAISMGPNGLPVVDEIRCTGCGTCERVCPKHIINLSSVTRRILREFTNEECTTPCQRACPAGINIREYIRQISLGDYHRAVQVIKERNPFPAIIGRICPRPCELDCRRKFVDEPVAINFLKRYAADFEKESGERILPYKAPASGRKIAVIGGGVEGLATAFFSARLGHEPTIFEATSKLGGLLNTAISADRLSREALDWDIDGVLEMGVDAQTGKALGKDFTINELLAEDFDAVFLASGGWDSRLARGKGTAIEESIPDTYLLLEVIQNDPEKVDSDGRGKISCNSDVVIVGGGKLALEAARICKSLGAKKTTVLFRETLENAPIEDADLEKAGDNDVNFIFNSGVSRLFGEENRLAEMECIDLETSTKQTLPVSTLVVASGRFPELIFVRAKAETDVENSGDESRETSEVVTSDAPESAEGPSKWEAFAPYKAPALKNQAGLFADGDVLSDYSAAIKAIGAGRRSAASIHQVMYGIEPSLSEKVLTPKTYVQNVDHVESVASSSRQIMPLCSPKELVIHGELEKGFSETAARLEADRCLQCGLICYERPGMTSKLEMLPDVTADGSLQATRKISNANGLSGVKSVAATFFSKLIHSAASWSSNQLRSLRSR